MITQIGIKGHSMIEIVEEWKHYNSKRKSDKLLTFRSTLGLLKNLSQCKRANNAAIVFNRDFSAIHAIGYNGPPKGGYAQCTSKPGDCLCIHAEANALLKLKTHEKGLIMLCTTSPCWYCAGAILNSGQIGLVIYEQPYRDARPGLNLLYHNGIDAWEAENLTKVLYSSG